MKYMPKPWAQSAENTMELIIDQIWGALQFPWQFLIVKCLKLSGVVSPPHMRLELPYTFLNICGMRLIVSSMIIIPRKGIPTHFKAELLVEWTIWSKQLFKSLQSNGKGCLRYFW